MGEGMNEYDFLRTLKGCPYKPFVTIESHFDVRGSSEVGLSVYNQVRFNEYMSKLTESGVDMLEHSHRVQRGMKVQAALRRKFKIKKKVKRAKSETRALGRVHGRLQVVK
jgi:hypothetical protein